MTTRSEPSRFARRSRAPRLAVALVLFLRAVVASPGTAHGDDAPVSGPLDALRERSREGAEKYRAGAYADAIVIWESIYRELGEAKGYRIAFNLGRAYDAFGDSTRAAEHYESYLEEVERRRGTKEALEPNVEKQAEEARERLDVLAATKGRIRVLAADPPVVVRVDNSPERVGAFVAYVEPGSHVVRFGGGGTGAEPRTVVVRAGQVVEVAPPAGELRQAPLALRPVEAFRTRTEHPLSPVIVWSAAGLALVSVVVPVLAYDSALSVKHEHDDPQTLPADKVQLASDYASARSNAYASLLLPAVLGATATGLALWYVLGAKQTRVPIAPEATIGPRGATIGATLRF